MVRVQFPSHVEITIGSGADSSANFTIVDEHDFDFTEAMAEQLQPMFEGAQATVQSQIHDEAPNSATQIALGGLRWWDAAFVARWPVRTGQSSAILGQSFLHEHSISGDTIGFDGLRPGGADLFYMEEIEYLGREPATSPLGSFGRDLPPLLLLESRIRQALRIRLARNRGIVARALRSV